MSDRSNAGRGIYVSSKKEAGTALITTVDIMMRNRKGSCVKAGVLRAISGMANEWIRNRNSDDIIYFGPLVSMNGFVLIIRGVFNPLYHKNFFHGLFEYVSMYDGIVAEVSATDMENARKEADRFLEEVVMNLGEGNTSF